MSKYLGLIILPIAVVVYMIAQILWTIRAKRKAEKHRQLAEGAIKSLAKKTLDPPFAVVEDDPYIAALEKELKKLKNEE